jgi:hypothetical protein
MVPYLIGEDPKDRHFRRFTSNNDPNYVQKISEFCTQHGVIFKINNNGHHWHFEKQSKFVDWWPSTAKLVLNQNWKRGIHVHDYGQVIFQLTRYYGLIC